MDRFKSMPVDDDDLPTAAEFQKGCEGLNWSDPSGCELYLAAVAKDAFPDASDKDCQTMAENHFQSYSAFFAPSSSISTVLDLCRSQIETLKDMQSRLERMEHVGRPWLHAPHQSVPIPARITDHAISMIGATQELLDILCVAYFPTTACRTVVM